MPQILVGPLSLNVETTGPTSGTPVVLLHGWGSSAHLMRPIAAGLEDAYRVFCIDLPGHGISPPPPSGWGVPEHAALLSDFFEERIDGPATIVGHSNGGRIGLYMASDPIYAHHVSRLALVSPSGITPRRSWKYYARKNIASVLKAPFTLLPGSLAEPGLDWLRHSLVWRALGSSDYRELTGVMRETFVKTVNCHLDDRVSRISVPVLIFWGVNDKAVTRDQMEILASRIPDAGLVVLENAGHFGFLDDFDVFIAATRYFLKHT